MDYRNIWHPLCQCYWMKPLPYSVLSIIAMVAMPDLFYTSVMPHKTKATLIKSVTQCKTQKAPAISATCLSTRRTAKRRCASYSIKRNCGKDEFLNIKNVSRDDMLAAHRVPPQMMGIIPQNTGGFGDVEKAARFSFVMSWRHYKARYYKLMIG